MYTILNGQIINLDLQPIAEIIDPQKAEELIEKINNLERENFDLRVYIEDKEK